MGQPAGADTICTQCAKGCQRHRVDQSEARMGQGIAPDPLHAAIQPGGERLLNVRHRTVSSTLDLKATSACAGPLVRTAAALQQPSLVARRARGVADALARRDENPEGVRFLVSAPRLAHEELFSCTD